VLAFTGTEIRPGTKQLLKASAPLLTDAMPGSSKQTRRVKTVNANWAPGPDAGHGRFEVMFINDDDQRHVAAPSPESMTALIAMVHADTVLAWDPEGRTLIVASIVGTMPWTEHAEPGPLWSR